MSAKKPESLEVVSFEKYMTVLSTPAQHLGEFVLGIDADPNSEAVLKLDVDALGVFRGTRSGQAFNYEGGNPHATNHHPGWQTFRVRSVDAKLTYDPAIHSFDKRTLQQLGRNYDAHKDITIMSLALELIGKATTRSETLSNHLRQGIIDPNSVLAFKWRTGRRNTDQSVYETNPFTILGVTEKLI